MCLFIFKVWRHLGIVDDYDMFIFLLFVGIKCGDSLHMYYWNGTSKSSSFSYGNLEWLYSNENSGVPNIQESTQQSSLGYPYYEMSWSTVFFISYTTGPKGKRTSGETMYTMLLPGKHFSTDNRTLIFCKWIFYIYTLNGRWLRPRIKLTRST